MAMLRWLRMAAGLAILLGLALVTGVSTFAYAEAPVSATKWYDWITVGGELRLRPEGYAGFYPFIPVRSGTSRDAYVLLRARVHMDAHPVDYLHVFIQPQFSRTFAQSESTIANSVAGTTEATQLDLHQGYMELKNFGPFSLKAGRMELIYGDQRLVGNFDWSNVARNFDGVCARLGWEKFRIDGFWTWIRRSSLPNQYFSGLYSHITFGEWLEAEPYVLYLRDNGGGLGGGRLNMATIGMRMVGKAGGWDYGMEVPMQVGKSSGQTVMANAAHVRGGYTFSPAIRPRIGVEYNYASGDPTPGVGSVKTFNNLFPTNHDKYGLMDLVGWRNIHDLRGSASIQPIKDLRIQLEYHAFWLPEPADGLYAASGAQLRVGSAAAGHFVGQEADLWGVYNWNRYFSAGAGYSIFRGGKFLRDTGTRSLAHWGYVQVTARF